MNTVKLIIVVPCYNEEEVLKETTRQLSDILALMENEGKIKEGKIIYVDDGSKDTTWTLIEQLADVNPRVMGLKLAHNVGHQQALWAGLEWVADSRYAPIFFRASRAAARCARGPSCGRNGSAAEPPRRNVRRPRRDAAGGGFRRTGRCTPPAPRSGNAPVRRRTRRPSASRGKPAAGGTSRS